MSELNEKLATAWEGFTKGDWQNEVNVRDFIQKNYTPYEGDESFLAGATEATTTLWDKVMEGVKLENRTHAPVDFDTAVASTITSHDAGYINKQLLQIERFKKLEDRKLSQDIDYSSIEGLRIEAAQKLDQIKPESMGQASRISGVSPADINVLLVYLEKKRRGK